MSLKLLVKKPVPPCHGWKDSESQLLHPVGCMPASVQDGKCYETCIRIASVGLVMLDPPSQGQDKLLGPTLAGVKAMQRVWSRAEQVGTLDKEA